MKCVKTLLALILLSCGPSLAGEWFIPAAAHADGEEGSVWRTKLFLRNFGAADLSVEITLLPRDRNNATGTESVTIELKAGESREIDDILSALFAFDGAAALRIESAGEELVVGSRTYNQAATGTFGQFIPGVRRAGAVQAEREIRLLGLNGADGWRSNVGWVNLESEAITVTVELFAGNGSSLGTSSFDEHPFGHRQFNVFTRLKVPAEDNVYAVLSASGTFQPYASVVASGSNDPIYVAALSGLDSAPSLLLPASAHVDGSGGTRWQTDLWVLNAGAAPAEVTIELWQQENAGSSPTVLSEVLSQGLGPGEQLQAEDVVLDVFGLDGAQAVLVVSSDEQLMATSRTYNTAPAGSFGQFIQGEPVDALGVVGEVLSMPGAVENNAFRTNLGVVSATSAVVVAHNLQLELLPPDNRLFY